MKKMHIEMLDKIPLLLLLWITISHAVTALHKDEEMPAKRLHHDLFVKQRYEKMIRPPTPTRDMALVVKLSMRLAQILSIDVKAQILTTSIWLRHEWQERRLVWDPTEYSGVEKLKIPSENLWRPDIVLYNNADGDFAITLLVKATVYNTGQVVWEPPAIVKSYCPIDVEFFPFDMQECFIRYGTWSYDGRQVDLHHRCTWNQTVNLNESIVVADGISLVGFYPNVEWDVINVTAKRKVKAYPCCPMETYPDIMFNVTLRRRTLFYSVNLIVPCMAISCLCVLVFYLPSDSCEKITLSISILLALTVFFLLLADLIPPTSLVIPLIVKYLLFTSIIVTLSIVLTVFVLTIHHRTPSTTTMSPWVRRVFTEILPKILLMRRPKMERPSVVFEQGSCNGVDQADTSPIPETQGGAFNRACNSDSEDHIETEGTYTRLRHRSGVPPELCEGLKSVAFIAERMKAADNDEAEERDWKYVAMVMDRLFLYVFTLACFLGATCIFLTAPALYDPRQPLVKTDAVTCVTEVVPLT